MDVTMAWVATGIATVIGAAALYATMRRKTQARNVAESDAFTFPELKKPIPTVPPMTAGDPQYLARKREVGEKVHTLKSGLKLAYFTEGSPVDGPCVLCLHGLAQTKFLWLEKKPIAGVYRIAVDRMGHGSLSTLDGVYSFATGVPEIIELLDALDVDKFYVVGHSMGGSWALCLAAAFPDRVLGCADISGMGDRYHCDALPAMIKEMPAYGNGCMGRMFRLLIWAVSEYFPDKDRDYGMAKKYTGTMKKEDGGDERAFSVMDRDQFFVTKTLDSYLHGPRSQDTFDLEFQRQLGMPWDYDTAAIKCPTFIYKGEKEATPLSTAESNHKLITGSELIIMPEHGHSTILLEAEKIILALVKGKSVKSRYA